MSLWTRVVNALAGDRLDRELDEEMRLHIEEAVAAGRNEQEARRAFGNLLLTRERSHDAKVLGWLEALAADTRFGARQLRKHKLITLSAILSLGLAIGASAGAFRLIDAMLLRPLPVSHPERLYTLVYPATDNLGAIEDMDSFTYPLLRDLRVAAKDDAVLLAIGGSWRVDVSYSASGETEKAYRQYVSGETFPAFGLAPALGRLLSPKDDQKPGAHPVAVISYQYWSSRFGRDPGVIGRQVRFGERLYDIVGVAPEGFTGTDTGTLTDLFVPAMMNARAIHNPDWSWFRVWVKPAAGVALGPLRDRLQAAFAAHRSERMKSFPRDLPPNFVEQFRTAQLSLRSASSGVSGAKRDYSRALTMLGILVGLVLLIACANLANLLTAQTAARGKEMALRVSIGAGRWRLIQLMLVESALLAAAATALGAVFAWWSAPWVASRVNPPDNPLALMLPADWRVLGFSAALSIAVTLLFGLAPALRAGRVDPSTALKGGDSAHARLRWIHVLVAGQVAFCFVVHFTATLFVATFERLTSQPLGFSPDRIVNVGVSTREGKSVSHEVWRQVLEGLRNVPGVESAALCGFPLMSGNAWTGGVRLPGRPPDSENPYFLATSPEFLNTMGMQLLDGRPFNSADGSGDEADPRPPAAIVSESFARRYFGEVKVAGRTFERLMGRDRRVRHAIVGVMKDLRYQGLREPVHPVLFVPIGDTDWATFTLRAAGPNPLALTSAIRREIQRMRPELQAIDAYSQRELVDQWSIRERLLAKLSVFFAAVAMLLAGIGLYGVLSYSVIGRTREIGIRIALGAPARSVAFSVTAKILVVLAVGVAGGLAAGLSSERLIGSLLYSTRVTDVSAAATPLLILGAVAVIASLPPVIRAVRIDPARALRAE